MSFKSRHLALIAAAACAVAPAAAAASTDAGSKPHCGIDYSRNSVSGEYCAPASNASAPVTPVVVTHDDGFSWGDAGVGAGGTFALIAVGAGGAIAFRRRQTPGKPVTS